MRASRPSAHSAAMASGDESARRGHDHPGRAGQRQLVHQRGRQDVQVVGVVDDEQQVVTVQRCPGRAQQRGRLADVGDLHQVAEGAERNRAFGRGAGDPADARAGMPAAEVFGGQPGQRGFTAAVRSEHDGPARRRCGPLAARGGGGQSGPPGRQRRVQPLRSRRVLGDVPSNRHPPNFIARGMRAASGLVYLSLYAPGTRSVSRLGGVRVLRVGPRAPRIARARFRTRRGDRRARLDPGVGRRPGLGDGCGGQRGARPRWPHRRRHPAEPDAPRGRRRPRRRADRQRHHA